MIEIKAISKSYGKKKNIFHALRKVSFEIPEGVSVAIVGKSGSGKSTLMHAMSGLDSPDEGEVRIGGKDILKFKNKELDRFRAEEIGFIFQSFFVQANETVVDNVGLPLEIAKIDRKKRQKMIEAALKSVELLEKKRNKAKDLSGGQKQRLAVARAIVNKPQIIFADEPTGNLDSVTGDKIEKLLFSYNKKNGVTLIIVTHDDDLAQQCDMRIYVKDGEIDRIEGKKGAKK